MNLPNPKVDFYFDAEGTWQEEINKLRKIVLSCSLTEELKWGSPCYTFEKKNIVLIHVFKEYCALLFFKGALLKDPENILVQQSENVQSARQARFRNSRDISKVQPALKACIYEAIEVEKAGLKVKLKAATDFPIAEEFAEKMKKQPALKKAFYELTPGRQRAYLLFFSKPKQSATRAARVEKYQRHIMNGKGLLDE